MENLSEQPCANCGEPLGESDQWGEYPDPETGEAQLAHHVHVRGKESS